ncbi:putative multiple myeloma tumor-associated protein [Plasmopara halstedii]
MSFGKTNYRNGGTRGGADKFTWEDVKNDKYRENYLGNSVQAPVGRWQKGKDLSWYAKARSLQKNVALQSELELAKLRDEDLMNEALYVIEKLTKGIDRGIVPKKRREPVESLSTLEIKELLKRGEAERDGMDVERVEGLGAAPIDSDGFGIGPKLTLAERYKAHLDSGKKDTTYALPGTVNEQLNSSEAKVAQMEARKAEKAKKKLKKMEKKERKKEKKTKRNCITKSNENVQDKLRRRSHHHLKDKGGGRIQSRSRSYSSQNRGRTSARRSRSISRYHNRSRSRSHSPSDRYRRKRSYRHFQAHRNRSRGSASPSQHRHQYLRSSSVSRRLRKHSRSRS